VATPLARLRPRPLGQTGNHDRDNPSTFPMNSSGYDIRHAYTLRSTWKGRRFRRGKQQLFAIRREQWRRGRVSAHQTILVPPVLNTRANCFSVVMFSDIKVLIEPGVIRLGP